MFIVIVFDSPPWSARRGQRARARKGEREEEEDSPPTRENLPNEKNTKIDGNNAPTVCTNLIEDSNKLPRRAFWLNRQGPGARLTYPDAGNLWKFLFFVEEEGVGGWYIPRPALCRNDMTCTCSSSTQRSIQTVNEWLSPTPSSNTSTQQESSCDLNWTFAWSRAAASVALSGRAAAAHRLGNRLSRLTPVRSRFHGGGKLRYVQKCFKQQNALNERFCGLGQGVAAEASSLAHLSKSQDFCA
ncbi:unnamed protein product, partial [Nesidiocoris tenuis]